MEGFDLFLKCLKDINDPRSVNEANEKLSALMMENTALYLTYASQVIINFCEENKENKVILESENDVIVSLGAIKSACTPKRTTLIGDIRSYWESDDPITNQMRPLVQRSILISITNQSIPIRKTACAALAAVLVIDKKNANNILQTVLTSTSSTDPLNFGAVMLFLEIFNLNAIPSEIKLKEIDKEAYVILLDIIFHLLTNMDQSIESSIKVDTSTCLKKLIANGDSELFDSEVVDKILEVIFFVFSNEPELSPELYKELHFVMLNLIDSLYEHAQSFCDKIFKITEIGFNDDNTSFKVISYTFWARVWKIESEKLMKSNNKDTEFINVTGHFCEPLINYGIQLISTINPYDKYLSSEYECQCNEYVFKALSKFFDNLMDTFAFAQNFDKFKELIEEFLSADETKNSDSYIQQHYAAVLIMRALVFDHTNDEVFGFITEKIPYIAEYAQSEIDYLSDASVKLLKELLEKNNQVFINPENINTIKKVIQVCSRFSNIVTKDAINLIEIFCNQLNSDLLDDLNFDILLEIFIEKFVDIDFLQSNGLFYLQKSFASFILNAGSHSKDKIINILENSILVIKNSVFINNYGFITPLALSVPDWDPNTKTEYSEDSIFYFSKDRFFLLRIIALIIQKYYPQNDMSEYISEVLDTLFRILQNQSSFLYEASLQSIAEIADIIKSDFQPYVSHYVPVLNDCLSSENPDLIRVSSYCLGNLCKDLGPAIGGEVKDIILAMFNLMTSFDDFQQMSVIDIFLSSFSKIVISMRDFLVDEMAFIINLFNFSLSLISFRVDLDNDNEYEFAEKLYTSLCHIFSSILEIIPPDNFDDKSFTNVLKLKLFPLFQKIDLLHTTNLALIKATVKLLGVLHDKKHSKYCFMFHRSYVKNLRNWFVYNKKCLGLYNKFEEYDITRVFIDIFQNEITGEGNDC